MTRCSPGPFWAISIALIPGAGKMQTGLPDEEGEVLPAVVLLQTEIKANDCDLRNRAR